MKIPFNTLDRVFNQHQQEYEAKVLEVLRCGWYVLGQEVAGFEKEFAAYLKAKHFVGVDNGLNAIVMAVRTLGIGPGDEVIVQANTYIASVMGITMNGATPVLVEPDDSYNIDYMKIEEKITERTKAVLVVHLYGQATNMSKIIELCEKYSLHLIEDCAQSHGAKYAGRMTGTFGTGCFSFYPSKNLGCFGDGGGIATDNDSYDKYFRILRNYGSEKRYYNQTVGYNSRLDEVQAGLLRVKLTHLEDINAERCEIATRYLNEIQNPLIQLPITKPQCTHVYYLFVIRTEKRDKFQSYLEKHDIGTIVHYPIPPHLSDAYRFLGYKTGDFPITEKQAETVLSLPLFNGMTKDEVDYVITTINNYAG
jgi:dTDP-4-amino-4,6-dideoxygalactose transaminase